MQKETLELPPESTQNPFTSGEDFIKALNQDPNNPIFDSNVPYGDQVYLFYDALNKILPDGTRTPVVVLRDKKTGEKIEIDAGEFLEKIGEIALTSELSKRTDMGETPLFPSEKTTEVISDHYKELFKPLALDGDADSESQAEDDFSDLFEDNSDLDDPDKHEEMVRLAVQEARIDNKNQKFINEESKQDSIQVLERAVQADLGLNQIIREYTSEQNITDTGELVDAIRKDKELRLKIGIHAVKKLDEFISLHPNEVPARIMSTQTKNPDNGPWAGQNLKSKDYVALLYLSMLDGSFSRDMEQDQIDYKSGVPETGQHRYMARKLIGLI